MTHPMADSLRCTDAQSEESKEAVDSGFTAAEIADELDRLHTIVERLPKTADGVPIVPGMTVYEVRPGQPYEMRDFRTTTPDEQGYSTFHWETGYSAIGRLGRVYSTREAAIAAKEADDAD